MLRDRRFRRYWTGQTVSLLGDQIALVAIPLTAVLVLHADAAEMGWLSTAGLLPALLLSIPAGAWADRRPRRRQVMIAADLGRAVLVASLPAAYVLGVLTFTHMCAVAFAVGTLSVLFDVCNATLFVSLLPARAYVQGNSLVNGSRAMSFVADPSVGGLLVQVLAAPLALIADTLSYLASAQLLARISSIEPPPARARKRNLTAGLRWISGNPIIRAVLAAAATVNYFNFMLHALFVLYATTELGLNAGVVGVVLGAGAIGALIGSMITGYVVDRAGIGPTTILGFLIFPPRCS